MSGIYIMGAEMPRTEPLIVKINPDGSVSSTRRNDYRKYSALVVPDHGRLGDLDELAGRIKAWITHNRRAMNEDIEPYVIAIFCGIQETPTIIPGDKEEE